MCLKFVVCISTQVLQEVNKMMYFCCCISRRIRVAEYQGHSLPHPLLLPKVPNTCILRTSNKMPWWQSYDQLMSFPNLTPNTLGLFNNRGEKYIL